MVNKNNANKILYTHAPKFLYPFCRKRKLPGQHESHVRVGSMSM